MRILPLLFHLGLSLSISIKFLGSKAAAEAMLELLIH